MKRYALLVSTLCILIMPTVVRADDPYTREVTRLALLGVPKVTEAPTSSKDGTIPAVRGNCGCQTGEPCQCPGACTCEFNLDYTDALKQAEKLGRPYVLFVGQRAVPIKGCVVSQTARHETFRFDTSDRVGIVVSQPTESGMVYKPGWLVSGKFDRTRVEGLVKASTEEMYPTYQTISTTSQPIYQQAPTYLYGGNCAGGNCGAGGCASGNCGGRGRR